MEDPAVSVTLLVNNFTIKCEACCTRNAVYDLTMGKIHIVICMNCVIEFNDRLGTEIDDT